MNKRLSEMTLEELWQLFPIILAEHNEAWKTWYAEEVSVLAEILPRGTEIYHIGSTAVNGILAKPIIDILVETDESCDLCRTAEEMSKQGYIIMSASDKRISLNKGYMESGFAERVFHIHLQHKSEKDEVLFRDYLNAHPSVAKDYESLKLKLWKQYEHDRDAYTEAKSDFVLKYTALAKAEKPRSE